MEDFINEKVEMLKNDFGKGQVKTEIYEFCFKNYFPNMRFDSVVMQCMELYAEVIRLYTIEIKNSERF